MSKEMIYQIDRKREVLDTGHCFGFLYYIMSLGTHPTAYIEIPKDYKIYRKSYDDIYKEVDLDVHGGFTYSDDHLWISDTEKIEGWFIGWDYAHCGDYMGYEELFPEEFETKNKKWSEMEIFEEVEHICYQLYKLRGDLICKH